MKIKNLSEDKCSVQCVDNDKIMQGEILNFRPEEHLSLSIQRSVKLEMKYNSITKIYEGKMAGLTFITKGPTITQIKTGR